MLTSNSHGRRDPWVYYNLATCLIQLGRPSKPLYAQEKEEKEKKMVRKQSVLNALHLQGSQHNQPMFGGSSKNSTMSVVGEQI